MSEYLIKRIDQCPNIEILTHTKVTELRGKNKLEEVTLERDGVTETLPAKSMNIFIGAEPKTYWLKKSVALNDKNFIVTGNDVKSHGWPLSREPFSSETNVPGIFCAGDARADSIKRIAAAVGSGSEAAATIHRYLALGERGYRVA